MTWQSRFQEIRNNKVFEVFIILVIISSALLVGVKTYEVPVLVLNLIQVMDWMITGIFVIEISIRFAAEERKLNFFKSFWNIFDTLIVAISLIPIENTDMALVARLIRVFRVMRMISIVPELRILMNSLLIALPRLGYVMALMFIIFYVYAALGSLIFEDINPDLWGDIAIATLTLFRVMTFEDWTDVMYETMTVYKWSWAYYVSFIFLTAFAFLNMVIGIVVNVLEEEHQKARREQHLDVTMEDLQGQIAELKQLIQQQSEQNKKES